MTMRIISIILLGAILLIGCEPPIDKTATTTRKPDIWEANIGEYTWQFFYVKVDGHQYLMVKAPSRGGITHSPKCPCLSTKVKENN